jgi:hypothetical protein
MASLEDLSFEARDELAALSRTLAENPSTRKDFLRLTKKIKPDLPIPELEIEEHTNHAVEAMRKENEAIRAKMREKEALDDLRERRSTLIRKGLVENDEQIAEVEKVMLEKGIPNHETAAEYWKWMRQSEAPTPAPFSMNVAKNQNWDLNKFARDPRGTARDVAVEALAELRKGKPIGF